MVSDVGAWRFQKLTIFVEANWKGALTEPRADTSTRADNNWPIKQVIGKLMGSPVACFICQVQSNKLRLAKKTFFSLSFFLSFPFFTAKEQMVSSRKATIYGALNERL